MHKLVEEWIKGRYVKESSAVQNRIRIKKFFDWSRLQPQKLLKMPVKDVKSLLVQWTREQEENGVPVNSILAYVASVRAFLDYHERPLGEIHNLPNMTKTVKDHCFSTDDLKKMWNISDVRDKALLSTFCSLGLGVGDILNLDTEYVRQLINRADSEKQEFISFELSRGKTQEKIFAILNPLAVSCLKDYLRTHKEPKLFDLTQDAVNKRLRSLAQEAGLVLVGRVRSHGIRAWLISELTVLGFSEFEVKLLTGKSIGYSDMTYLEGLKRQILEKYRKVYPKICLSTPNGNGGVRVEQLSSALQQAESDIRDLRTRNTQQQELIDGLEAKLLTHVEDVEGLLKTVGQLRGTVQGLIVQSRRRKQELQELKRGLGR